MLPLGMFSHGSGTTRAQRAPGTNSYAVYPRNTPENHPPIEACMIHSKRHGGCRIQDPGTRGKHHGTRGKHQTKTKTPLCTSRACRVLNSGPRAP